MQKTILALLNISSEDYRLYESIATLKQMPKNSLISYPSKVNRKMFFIDQGLLRGYRYAKPELDCWKELQQVQFDQE